MTVHISTSGWNYDHWEGVLYRYSLEQRARPGVYTQHFYTMEANSSFYHWLREATLTGWRRSATEVKARLAADFTGWKRSAKKFDAQCERLIKALRADSGRSEPSPVPKL